MNEIIIKSQEEFDKIPQDYNGRIYVEFGTPYNRAAINRVFERAIVTLRENSSAELRGNSSAVLWENSSAVLWENSSAVLWGNSSAELRGNSRAMLRENSSAVLWGNSSAVLWGNSSAVLWGNSSAVLWGNSQAVDAETKGNVKVNGNARVVYLPRNIEEYIKYYSLDSTDEYVTLYKAVHKHKGKYFSNYDASFQYRIGEMVETPEFSRAKSIQCGKGIHLAHKSYALDFGAGWSDCAILECRAKKEDVVVPIPNEGKVRVPRCEVIREVPLEECGVYGKMLAKRRANSD